MAEGRKEGDASASQETKRAMRVTRHERTWTWTTRERNEKTTIITHVLGGKGGRESREKGRRDRLLSLPTPHLKPPPPQTTETKTKTKEKKNEVSRMEKWCKCDLRLVNNRQTIQLK